MLKRNLGSVAMRLAEIVVGITLIVDAVFDMISGIFGNSIDRIWRGEVVDFLDCWIGSYRWPTFNIADCAICIGIGIFMISAMFRPEPAKKDQPEAEKTAKQESAASDK